MADQRFVLSARMIGGVHRDTPKLKMFMISVLWSDEAEVIIYRSFKDFKSFHRELKKKFPHLNPFRKNDRMLPKFTGKAMMSSLPKKGAKKSVKKMKFLESYCVKLLRCDPSVTQSPEMTRFFNPREHDLQPDFTKNSVVILLSDHTPDGSGGAATIEHAGSVTHPFVTQTYRCVAPYETKDIKNKPFKAAKDEKLDVLIKNSTGWWLVESETKCLAWFPAPYLELWEGEDDDSHDIQPHGGSLYCAVRSYTSNKVDEVSVSIGSVVEVLRKSDNGWWLIRFNNKAGYIPSMYLQPYNNPRAGLHSLHSKLHSSTLNLASSRDSSASFPPSITEEDGPELDYEGPSRGVPAAPGRLHKARSLDILSEGWSQPQPKRNAAVAAAASETSLRRMSSTSAETSFSDFSSSSDESLQGGRRNSRATPDQSKGSVSDSSRSSSSSSVDGRTETPESVEIEEATPKVPPRPQTKEILTRCTTMTRKAALATQTRLQGDAVASHSR